MKQPKVSVIIPAYNAEEYIERAMKSVLGQTHEELELIVVDDGSTDGTQDIAARIAYTDTRAHIIRMPNSGPAVARNRGMEAISPDADYVMFVDADDYIAPDAVEYALTAAAMASSKRAFRSGSEAMVSGVTTSTPSLNFT